MVHARPTPETLSRIVLLFHRRRIPIDSLVPEHDKQTDSLRIDVHIEEVEGQAEPIESTLYKLGDVLLVENKNSGGDMVGPAEKDGRRKR